MYNRYNRYNDAQNTVLTQNVGNEYGSHFEVMLDERNLQFDENNMAFIEVNTKTMGEYAYLCPMRFLWMNRDESPKYRVRYWSGWVMNNNTITVSIYVR